MSRALVVSAALAALALSTSAVSAQDCSDVNPGARRPRPDDGFYNGVRSTYGNVCVLQDFDPGRGSSGYSDYYARSEARCRGLPGHLTWVKDSGSGYNLCIFNPAAGSSPSSRGSGSAGSTPRGSAPSGPNSCTYANDGTCDEPNLCPPSTDTNDCRAQPSSVPRRKADEDVPGQYTDFSLCNKWHETIVVAFSYWDETEWLREGWMRIDSGRCARFGKFAGDSIYIYAESVGRRRVWKSDTGPNMCIRHPGPFKLRQGSTCQETVKYFQHRFINKGRKDGLNLN